jgi:hypothetical protein
MTNAAILYECKWHAIRQAVENCMTVWYDRKTSAVSTSEVSCGVRILHTTYIHRYIHYVQDNDITWRVNVNDTKQCGLRRSQNKGKIHFTWKQPNKEVMETIKPSDRMYQKHQKFVQQIISALHGTVHWELPYFLLYTYFSYRAKREMA